MTIKNAIQLFLLALLTLVIGIPAILLGLLVPGQSRKGRIFRWVTKSYSAVALPLFGVTLETRGLSRVDRGKPYVFMSNHVSHVDSPALALSIPHPLHWVFKKGGFSISLRAGLPIVPVRVSGSRDIVPSGLLSVRPGHVVVELFDPVPTDGLTEADIPALMARVRDALLS